MSCEHCGFGFLFELMDDYFPSPLAGIFVCDREGRVLAFGHGATTLSGYREADLIGSDLEAALELRATDDGDPHPHRTAIEWGVRVQGREMTMHTADGAARPVTADFFPAYDDDGGLLAVFTPRTT